MAGPTAVSVADGLGDLASLSSLGLSPELVDKQKQGPCTSAKDLDKKTNVENEVKEVLPGWRRLEEGGAIVSGVGGAVSLTMARFLARFLFL